MRLPRKIKKNLRCILLCYTGNPSVKKAKYSNKQWLILKKDFQTWLDIITMEDRKGANTVYLYWRTRTKL